MGDKETEPRYKIGEVCRLADVQPYVLRYWEAEFPILAPDKGAQGPRTYSAQDLKTVERIKQLLYDEGYTIAGAKKRLEAEQREGGAPPVAAELPSVLQPTPPIRATSPATSAQTAPVEPPRPRRGRGRDTSPVVQATLEEAPPEIPALPVLAMAFFEPSSATPAESSLSAEPFDAPAATTVEPDPFAPVAPVRALVATAPVKALESRVDPTPAPVVQPPDPRVAPALAELRAILALLSREEP